MLRAKILKDSETFNDGVLNVLKATDGVIEKNIFCDIKYGNKTFGVSRFFNAQVSGNEIDKMIVIPFVDCIDRTNILELREHRTGNVKLFEIVMIQELFNSAPRCLQITLRKTGIKYVDNRCN